MLVLEPNLFHYKLFMSNKQITEDDLCNALKTFPNFWTKKDLKSCIAKVGLTFLVRSALKTYKNPLLSYFTNSNDKAEYVVVRDFDLDHKYMTSKEYQYVRLTSFRISNMTKTKDTQTTRTVLAILKRYPSTTQSRILIKHLKDNL